ncbi:endonuclease III [Entomospira entomophila]|uniref:Endonuclease III n=1 Tax=Entomospira entomophila TaxID=2719988 RepID=A0A968GAE4_9SPIO|nr:endonuclease III [Entomospira entomophilus]NIZ40750.1 endonuclease III [Entomospira entomophilus]WDI34963.1 endonuclease III [Entomospira entomophilus]
MDNEELKLSQFLELLDAVYHKISPIEPLYHSAFEVLVFCIISLRTKDPVAYAAADRLFAEAHTPSMLAQLSIDDIASLIYPAGFYRRKAEQILAIATDLVYKKQDQPPKTREELLAYAGVGIKTANLTLSRGFNIPAICVDIHVHRITNRMQILTTSTPEETELALQQILPKQYWININPILVYLGQNYCRAKPICGSCPFYEVCPLTKSDKHK